MTFHAKSRPPVYIPDRGDIIHIDFSPSAGSETALEHFAVVLTRRVYNEKSGRAVVCPITSKRWEFPFHLPMAPHPPHLKQAGEIMTDQVRSVDLRQRGSSFAGRVEEGTLRDLVDLLIELVEPSD